ncbi:MAG: hypothetical protein PHX44_00580 [Sulfurimonas sp.]|uniref:hypothetical protein n=1 Tax=Sulfurimonas sp. TaxID=2022749 RepID=UPI002638BE7B|nr:hypothetical protein [Sulfurimonas sp.]MDD2651532.1 hypothetical protein [Sulfurimonas sp.]MDD3451073.1 hypothetical protein [Sulfurimonas sp.]
MKKIVLSTIAALAVSATALSAAQQFYVDEKGQVFTTSAPDRIAIENKESSVLSKAKSLEFSGVHYFGYTSANPQTTAPTADADAKVTVPVGIDTAAYAARSSGFELRRNYVQVKGFFNDKDYWRVTLDATKELASSKSYADVFVKYAYLYLDGILPYTGVEFGIAHRPWIDYEEHNGWYYRSFNKVVVEEKGTATEAGVDLVNSSDLGANFKTKTENFSSEIGIFNGEGYHADKKAANQENDSKMSIEWRLTGHLLGSGKKVGKQDRTKDTYAHLSTFGLISHNHKDDTVAQDAAGEYDRTFYGIHAVYNQPMFLLAAQYITAEDKARNTVITDGKEYDVMSINAEFRPIKDWTVIGRYDDYTIDKVAKNNGGTSVSADGTKVIAGLAYKYNKYVTLIGSAKFVDEEKANGGDTGQSKDVYMLTTEVKW